MAIDLPTSDWPMFGLAEDVRPLLARLARSEANAVLATLIQAEGGSPRALGAQMLLGGGEVCGYLSGGCIEADIALQATDVIATGRSRRVVYGRGGAVDLRLPCGGRIEVLLERLDLRGEAVRRVLLAYEARLPCLWMTDGERQNCLFPGEQPPAELEAALRSGGAVCEDIHGLVYRRYDPRPRLVVFGGDPPALAVAQLGAQCGLETTLVRPNGPAVGPPIKGVAYSRASSQEALGGLGLDNWTSVVAATHTSEIDDEVLSAALSSPAGYVGVLGSSSKIEERKGRLRARGLSEDALARLTAPLGLPLGGKAPWTIALSALAQIVGDANQAEQRRGWAQAAPPRQLKIEGVVLAAGAGRRFGGDKLLAPLGAGVVLDGALKAAFGLGGKVRLVIAPADEAMAAAASRIAIEAGRSDDLHIVRAYHHAEGLAGSLRDGVRAAAADGIVVFLGDMPLVPVDSGPLLEHALQAGAKAAAFVRQGRRGHPVGFARPLFAELLSLQGDRGASDLLDRMGEALTLIETEEDGLFRDIDTPRDLLGLRRDTY